MDKEIVNAIRELNEKYWNLNKQINQYADDIHETSTENIADNSGGIDELGSTVSDSVSSIDELATIISSQETRIETLEKEIESLKGGKA